MRKDFAWFSCSLIQRCWVIAASPWQAWTGVFARCQLGLSCFEAKADVLFWCKMGMGFGFDRTPAHGCDGNPRRCDEAGIELALG
jgi:hypothetical protein